MNRFVKDVKNIDSQLVLDRLQNLSDFAESSICPQGKWQGLDVFTWNNPQNFQLESTIIAFPFPVMLVYFDYECLEKSRKVISSHDWVFSYFLIDEAIINGEDLEGVVVVPDLVSLSQKLHGFKSKAIVLFISYNEFGNKNIGKLINFLNLETSK